MRFFSCKTITIGIATSLGLFSAGAYAAPHQVTVGGGGGLTFSPNTLSIAAGDTVTFSYAGGVTPHNVRSDLTAVTQFRCALGCDGQGGNGTPTGTAWSATITFPTAGTVPFYCEIHGAPGGIGMSGVITVTTPVDLQSFEVD
jgi:plastocyanin